ncbi:hypothetical protein Ancab_023386 [Ancistrocladus abbreviatus]
MKPDANQQLQSSSSKSIRLKITNFTHLNNLPEDEISDDFEREVIDLSKYDNWDTHELFNKQNYNEIKKDVVDLSEDADENASGNSFEPFIGQCFLSDEEAYRFYENFSKRSGFLIRRGQFTKKKWKNE